MIYTVILVAILAAPIVALAASIRDHQLMAPNVGLVDAPTRTRGEASLRGATVGRRELWPVVRMESWRLVRHPAPYLVAAPLCTLSLLTLTYSSLLDYARDDLEFIVYLVPLAWGTLIASNLLTLRSQRWHSEELLTTLPVPQRSRTLAHLLACLAMVPVSMAFLAVALTLGALSGRTFGSPRPWVLATAVLIVVGGGMVGVAVARWLPHPAAGWMAVIATLLLQVNFGWSDPQWRWLHFSMGGTESIAYPSLSADHHFLHVIYLTGGIVLVAAVALARDGFDTRVGALLGGACVILLVTGFLQVRPASEQQAAAFASRMQDPAASQTCSTHDGFIICADPEDEFLVPYWVEPVEGVMRRVPDGVLADPLVIRQRPTIEARTALAREIAVLVDPSAVWPDDDEVSLSNSWALPAPEDDFAPGQFQLSLAFRTASALVGLPADAWWSMPSTGSDDFVTIPLVDVGDETTVSVLGPMVQCSTAGEARGVAAIWLAGQSTPRARSEVVAVAGRVVAYKQSTLPIAFDAISNYVESLPSTIPEQGAVPSGGDVVAAAALLTLDDDDVADVLETHWAELTGDGADLATTAEMLTWFEMDATDARDVVASTAPAPESDPDPEDIRTAPAITGTCPAARS